MREQYLDYAKGIGIILVILAHVNGWIGDSSGGLNRFIYSFHMPLFFVISGFTLVFSHGYRSVKEIFAKNARRLLIPYFVWSAIYIGINAAENILQNKPVIDMIYERTCAALSFRGIAPLWFLGALFLARVGVSLLIRRSEIKKENRINVVNLFTAVAIVLSILFFFIYNKLDVHSVVLQYIETAAFRFFPSMVFVLIGYQLGTKRMWLKDHSQIICAASFAVLAFAHLVCDNAVNMHLFIFDSMIVFLITGMVGSLATITLCMSLSPGLFLKNIGRASLDIMALHYPPIPNFCLIEALIPVAFIKNSIFLASLILLIVCYLEHALVMQNLRKAVRILLK